MVWSRHRASFVLGAGALVMMVVASGWSPLPVNAAAASGVSSGVAVWHVSSTSARAKVWTQISSGQDHTCALDRSGRAYCWGANYVGQLGDGSTRDRLVPVAVHWTGKKRGKILIQISASGSHTCALDTSGHAFCWGDNYFGQLGNGITTNRPVRVPVAVSRSGVLAKVKLTRINAGEFHTCSLSRSGRAYCWGANYAGQLGSNGGNRPTAVHRPGRLARVPLEQISAGYTHTCALDAFGHAYCWGSGALGDATHTSYPQPLPVDRSGVLAKVTLTSIRAGSYHTCALSRAGRAYCWGENQNGQLGNGSTTGEMTPVGVDRSRALAGRSLVRISAGGYHTCVLDTSGHAYCWGRNKYGQLGSGSTDRHRRMRPVPVSRSGVLAKVFLTRISAGEFHTCALDNAGHAYCWGDNNAGQLGIGGTRRRPRPVAVKEPAS